MSALGEVRVDDVPERSRFEVTVDSQQAGYAEYSLRSDRMVLPHTVVENGYRGRGLAGRLAREALDSARARGLKVVPECSYIADYIARHPEYADLTD